MLKKKIVIWVFIYICVFCYSFFVSSIFGDEIWNYGVAYNISTGMVPYRDFNLVTTPLYPMLASVFIKIFGSYLYSFYIFNTIIVTLIIFISYKVVGKKIWVLVPFIVLYSYPGYNILSILLLFIVLYAVSSDIRRKDIIIGLLVGLLFLTKQTVGVCLFIPMIYYSKDKIKSFISFLIPIIIFLIYLLWNQALYQFIDYCFLGLFDFGKSNSNLLFLPFEIVVVCVLIYYLFKSKFKKQEYFYVLMFQIIAAPIFDDYHFMLGFIPFIYLLLQRKQIIDYKFKYYVIIAWFTCIFLSIKLNHFHDIYLIQDKNSYLYGRNIPEYIEKGIRNIGNYINQNRDDYDNIYFFNINSYLIKLSIEYPLSKYDLINNGNMGYHGDSKYIHEVDNYCEENKCMFILYRYEFREDNSNQTNRDLFDYVVDKYNKIDSIDLFDVYVN